SLPCRSKWIITRVHGYRASRFLTSRRHPPSIEEPASKPPEPLEPPASHGPVFTERSMPSASPSFGNSSCLLPAANHQKTSPLLFWRSARKPLRIFLWKRQPGFLSPVFRRSATTPPASSFPVTARGGNTFNN